MAATVEPSSHRFQAIASIVLSLRPREPYWGLRDYGTATWEGGDAECDHVQSRALKRDTNGGMRPAGEGTRGTPSSTASSVLLYKDTCGKCGATRIDSQLGLERTPEEYVANMVAVFREVRRVLKPSGTCWLNLGDSYASDMKGSGGDGTRSGLRRDGRPEESRIGSARKSIANQTFGSTRVQHGLKPKDLVGIPWLVAKALQAPYYTGKIKSREDRAWLSALVDGEGTFTILSTTSPHGSGNSYPPIVQVRMTSQGVVQKAASLVGVASPAQYPPSGGSNRAVYQWRLSGRRAADIAAELFPTLIEKRKQAMVVWNHQAIRDSYTTKRGVTIPVAALEKQQACRDIIRRLNRGEHVDLPSWMVEPPSLYEPGWYLRADVIWSKPNPMPESVTDRPTKSHEYLFLLTKQPRYYFDADAVRETATWGEWNSSKSFSPNGQRAKMAVGTAGGEQWNGTGTHADENKTGRNIRSVWNIATRPYPGAHFAVFPPELPERCIKAGSSEKGVCPECGAPWERTTERGDPVQQHWAPGTQEKAVAAKGKHGATSVIVTGMVRPKVATGWRPTCDPAACESARSVGFGVDGLEDPRDWGADHSPSVPPVPAVILDPFGGSGTVGMVANRLSRRAILIDLNPEYLEQQMKRNAQAPLGLAG